MPTSYERLSRLSRFAHKRKRLRGRDELEDRCMKIEDELRDLLLSWVHIIPIEILFCFELKITFSEKMEIFETQKTNKNERVICK